MAPKLLSLFAKLKPYTETASYNTDNDDSLNGSSANNTKNPIKDRRRIITTTATPGLTTLLDVALYRSNEGALTSTVCAANATLACFLQLKKCSMELLGVIRGEHCEAFARLASWKEMTGGGGGNSSAGSGSNSGGKGGNNPGNHINLQSMAACLELTEHFANLCIDCSNEAVERLTTDKISKCANLTSSSISSAASHSSSSGSSTYSNMAANDCFDVGIPDIRGGNNNHNQNNNGSNHNDKELQRGVLASSSQPFDSAGRNNQHYHNASHTHNNSHHSHHNNTHHSHHHHGNHNNLKLSHPSSSLSPSQPSRKDCWESPRLYCPDYVWADDALIGCHRLLRTLGKHDIVTGVVTSLTLVEGFELTTTSLSGIGSGGGGGNGSGNSHTGSGSGGGGSGGGNSSGNDITTLLLEDGWPNSSYLDARCVQLVEDIVTLIRYDIPGRLHQFRCAVESDATVSKRLYLVKNEYRAPFRAFLESHIKVQRAPRLDMVDAYLKLHQEDNNNSSIAGAGFGNGDKGENDAVLKGKKMAAEKTIQDAIRDECLIHAMEIEQQCEILEIEMARMLLPFSDLARFLDSKRARVREIPGVIEAKDAPALEELLRRLRAILCRKPGNGTSTGIRPILLDIQGVPRDPTHTSSEIYPFGRYKTRDSFFNLFNFFRTPLSRESIVENRLSIFLTQLEKIYAISKTKHAFFMIGSGSAGCSIGGGDHNNKKEQPSSASDLNIPSSIIKACGAVIDVAMFRAQYLDWINLIQKQRALSERGKWENEDIEPSLSLSNEKLNEKETIANLDSPSFEELSEIIRKAEIEVSIAMAPKQALMMVRKMLNQIEKDKILKFQILQEMVEEISLREMDFHMKLNAPGKDVVLQFPEMKSTLGLFGLQLQLAGESLPVG